MPAAVLIPLATAGAGLYGSYMEAEAQSAASKKQTELGQAQLTEQEREFGIATGMQQEQEAVRRQAYQSAIDKSKTTGGQFLTAAETASPELAGLKKNIISGAAESLQQTGGQLRNELYSQGVRGGQAATLLKEGLGDISVREQRDINQLMGSEAQQRESEKRAYLAELAKTQAAGVGGDIPAWRINV